jgi:di/tricarboxylate transporter|tara:strand:+ start:628 stop:2421 length:1794 start_codon:yes stop_codon:yes gene_type:complete
VSESVIVTDQTVLFLILGAVFGFLLWGRVRYDLVAFGALVVAVIAGAVPSGVAFSGFGHPATVIVALVLIVSRGLSNSGAVELLARYVVSSTRPLVVHIGLMSGVGAVLSAVMNNVAALALLMPIDSEAATRAQRGPGLTLMPLSFATILGGMVTLIGTPTNIVIATFRGDALGEPFAMFDFAAVGGVVALVGIVFVTVVGWRLLPKARRQRNSRQELQDLSGYVAEAVVLESTGLLGEPLRELYPLAEEHDIAVLGMVRGGQRLPGTARRESLRSGDLIVVEGAAAAIDAFIGASGLEHAGRNDQIELLGKSQVLMEAVVQDGARIAGRSARDVRLAYRHGAMLLGVARQGQPFRERVRKLSIRAGDVLLLSGPEDRMLDIIAWLGCLPLAERGLRLLQRRKAGLAIGLFAIAILAASTGLVYLPVALAAAAAIYVVLGLVPASEVYESVEWPVIVLLACLIPIGGAFESSGCTALIVNAVLGWTEGMPIVLVVVLLMLITMTLSDVLNNVATALIAAPIALELANRLEVNPDPLLMAVAVAASCAFLTPIGHKNNTIIMGPGGYRFGDYWRMGLPLEILVVVVSVPMILLVWPLN